MRHDDEISNPSSNPTFAGDPFPSPGASSSRAAWARWPSPWSTAPGSSWRKRRDRPCWASASVPLTGEDRVIVPPGYTAAVLYAWGDPVSNGPQWDNLALDTWQDQEQQAGMHHDGMYFFPLPYGSTSLGSRPPGHEPRIRRPRAALPGRHRQLVGGQGPQVPGRPRRLRDRGRAPGREWEVVRPSQYGRRITAYTPMRISGPAAGDAGDADGGGPRGDHRPRHREQLRQRLHALGHVPGLRGELERLLRQPHAPHPREPVALRDQRGRRRLPLARVRRALGRRRPPERAQPLRLGGGDRSLRPRPHAGEAHGPGPHQARGGGAHGGPRRPGRPLHGRRRAVRIRLQVRHPRPLEPVEPGRQHRPPGQRDALRRPVQRRRRRAGGSRSCSARTASTPREASRARPTCSSARARRPTGSEPRAWTARSG